MTGAWWVEGEMLGHRVPPGLDLMIVDPIGSAVAVSWTASAGPTVIAAQEAATDLDCPNEFPSGFESHRIVCIDYPNVFTCD